jgi:hypothetical protein
MRVSERLVIAATDDAFDKYLRVTIRAYVHKLSGKVGICSISGGEEL